jgi:hypothetical protein
VTSHPDLYFTVVINPYSGPGPNSLPDGNYTREIPKLNAYGNVRTIGYVSTAWTTRNLSAVLDDIAKYGGWASENSSLTLQGIFFDETPSIFDRAGAGYLDTIGTAVKASDSLGQRLVGQSNSASVYPLSVNYASCQASQLG